MQSSWDTTVLMTPPGQFAGLTQTPIAGASDCVVLRAWSLKTAPRLKEVDLNYVPSEDEFAAAVRDSLTADLVGVLGAEATAEAVPLAVHRPAEEALVEASRYAAVTVVGARGTGLARLLGSVSASVVRNAQGPVVVIPQDGERGR